MLGRELEGRANKLVRESKERAEKAKRQAEKERILRQRQEDRQRQFEEQKLRQRLAEEAAVETVSPIVLPQRRLRQSNTDQQAHPHLWRTGAPETRRGLGQKQRRMVAGAADGCAAPRWRCGANGDQA